MIYNLFMGMELYQQIGTRLKAAREEAGLTQTDVGELLGLERNSYTQIELGRNALKIEHLVTLCNYYQKSPNYFLGYPLFSELEIDESELVELYRALPADVAKEYTITTLRAWAKLQPAPATPSPPTLKVAYPSMEDIMDLIGKLDQLEIVNVYDYARWRYSEQGERRESSGGQRQQLSEAKRQEYQETVELIDLYLAVHAATPERREAVILYLIERLELKQQAEAKAAASSEVVTG